jgi:repressor LexA
MASASPSGDSDHSHVLTERRQAILDFHRDYLERHGYAPSMREIGDAVGLNSVSAVSYQLRILEEMGLLTRTARRPRTAVAKLPPARRTRMKPGKVRKVPADVVSTDMVSVPLFDRIAAGTPVIANLEPEDIMQLPREHVGSGDLFAVKVTGDSMVNASIYDGDIVVVRHQDDARNGDIVAALIEEEATVKTLRRMNGQVWLLPQNPVYEPISGDHCRIMGKVVATIHQI